MLSKAESILLWSSNIWGFGMGMLGPLYVLFAKDVGGDVLEIAWVYALYLCVMGIGVLVVGKVADRVGHEVLMVSGYAVSALATFGYLLVESMTGLFVIQIIIGIATALWEPTWFALYDRHSGDGNHDGYIWGLSSGLWYIFRGAAILIGGYVITVYSFDTLFICMGAILTIATLYTAQILRYRVQYKH
jgi:MFS family permease